MLIGELAEISGLSKDGIRHYEEMGIISSSPRRAGSRWYRDYDRSVLAIIERVRLAQQLGFSLREIGPLLKAYNEREFSADETTEFLEDRLKVIQEKIRRLREVEDFIAAKLERYRSVAD